MKGFVVILIFLSCSSNFVIGEPCTVHLYQVSDSVEFKCTGISKLDPLQYEAYRNTTAITIFDSDLTVIPGNAFSMFSPTLKSLDMHSSRIRTIEPNAFWGLVNLEELILWGNNLTWIPGDWFIHLTKLKTLDVSFNSIYGIDYNIFYKLPYLSSFYFDNNNLKTIDYNLFPVLTQLRKAEFGKNPWNWMYRVLLTWQLDNQRVDYRDSWDEWGWMSSVIQQCQNDGYGVIPDRNLLFCALKKLTEFSHSNAFGRTGQATAAVDRSSASVQSALKLRQCIKTKVNETSDALSLKVVEVLSHGLGFIETPSGVFHR